MDPERLFTHDGYRRMLEAGLDAGYAFAAFPDGRSARSARVCLLRHDCDNDLVAARDMAQIERDLGVRSTYFLMTRSQAYNVFMPACLELVREIVTMGHHIGLHFDEQLVANDATEVVRSKVDRERAWLADEFSVPVSVVSFHQPGPRVIGQHIRLNCVNTYDRADMVGFHYLSDSNMAWREDPVVALRGGAYPRLHMLVHPEWWTREPMSIREKWNLMFRHNFELTQETMLKRERAYAWRQTIELR